MNKKAFKMETDVFKGIIILLIVLVVSFFLFRGLSNFSSLTNPDVQICLQSSLSTGNIMKIQDVANNIMPNSGEAIVPYNCPVTVKEISISDLDRATTGDRARMNDYGYSDDQVSKYKVDSAVWQQISECFQKVNYGRNNLFDRTLLNEDNPTYCVVCSVISFDDNIQKKIVASGTREIKGILDNKTDAYTGKSVSRSLLGRVSVVGNIDPTYQTTQKQAVIYYRTPASVYQKWFLSLPSRSYAGFVYSIPFDGNGRLEENYIDELKRRASLAISDAKAVSDVDGVMIVPYESKDSLSRYCNIRGNEKFVP